MYWLSKMHRIVIDSRFIVASKSWSTKSLSGIVSKTFKMIYNHVKNFITKVGFTLVLKNSVL